MKNIYFAHSREINYQDLYKVFREKLPKEEFNIILPHEKESFFNSKDFLKNKCDLVIAEVSKTATGLGIELGWANLFKVPIVCFSQKEVKTSRSLKLVCNDFFEYENLDDFKKKVEKVVESK